MTNGAASAPGQAARRDGPNVLLVTIDQLRADHLSCAGHPLVRTPNLDRLAAAGVRFVRHYSQAAPCAPGRASLYTGMYQFNHRVVANGTPLSGQFDNVFAAARRAGRAPVVFGYTDQSIDPRLVESLTDPRLSSYSPGWLPGARLELALPDDPGPWVAWLGELGYDTGCGADDLLATEHRRPDSHSITAFLTDRALSWFDENAAATGADDAGGRQPWFVHLSYLRPHPPFSAAGEWATRFVELGDELDELVGSPVTVPADPDPFHRRALASAAAAPADPAALRRMRAHYLGMIEHVDDQIGRIFDRLGALGVWEETLVVITADHAEMLGDHGLQGKLGYWEQSYAIPCIVRDPRHPDAHGGVVEHFTENVDVMPTICAALGIDIPVQCDGRSLGPFLSGAVPADWRVAAHWEFDWRERTIRESAPAAAASSARLEHLAAVRTDTHLYVQFGDGDWLCFDLSADPSGSTRTSDPAAVLPLAQEMLVWRSRHTDRTLTDMLCEHGGIGRWPTAAARSTPTGH